MNTNNNQIMPFKGQVWEVLRSQYNSYNLFHDPLFPAVPQSIFFSRPLPDGVEWKRPRDVMRDPKFIVDGFDRADLEQGLIGNCWFIAGCVGIMQSKECFSKVVPLDQGYDNYYGGMFHFRFWQYGQWVDVVIDDMLPFFPNGKLVFCSNKKQPNELWGALLEKAYAKLYGSYESLDGGSTVDALIDMSGGIEESFDLSKMNPQQKQEFWSKLVQAFSKGSIIGCNITPDPGVREARLSNGLVRGHAFTVTNIATVNAHGRQVTLVRCRNPWGNEIEWKGAWKDRGSEWRGVSDMEKNALGVQFAADGEFWMECSDFLSNWDNVHICHLSGQSLSSPHVNSTWSYTMHYDSWVPGFSAGGCGQINTEKFWTNPQFCIRVTEVDRHQTGLATIIIELMQKDSRIKRRDTGCESTDEFIQFRLFRVKNGIYAQENTSNGLKFYSNQLDRVGSSGSYINLREVTQSFQVPPGDYVIIPSTYDEDKPAEFLLRIFTEHPISYNTLTNNRGNLAPENILIDQNDFTKTINKMGIIGIFGQKILNKATKYMANRLLPLAQNQKGVPIYQQHSLLQDPFAGGFNQPPQYPGNFNQYPIDLNQPTYPVYPIQDQPTYPGGFNQSAAYPNTFDPSFNNINQPMYPTGYNQPNYPVGFNLDLANPGNMPFIDNNQPSSGFTYPPYPNNFNQANNLPQYRLVNQPSDEFNPYSQQQGFNNMGPYPPYNIMPMNVQEACNLM